MPKAKRALAPPPKNDTIALNCTSGTWQPPNPQDSSVQPDGTVQFVPNKDGWVWTMVGTTLTSVFVGQTTKYVQVLAGQPNTFLPNVADQTTVIIIPLDVNSKPPQAVERIGGTIKVSSTGLEGEHKSK
jgi:hypothetical protein